MTEFSFLGELTLSVNNLSSYVELKNILIGKNVFYLGVVKSQSQMSRKTLAMKCIP